MRLAGDQGDLPHRGARLDGQVHPAEDLLLAESEIDAAWTEVDGEEQLLAEVTADDLREAVDRTWVRGYTIERRVGYEVEDYALPAEAHQPAPASKLPYFNTPEFFDELRTKVTAVLDERAETYGYV